jgi:hypothetical protein
MSEFDECKIIMQHCWEEPFFFKKKIQIGG